MNQAAIPPGERGVELSNFRIGRHWAAASLLVVGSFALLIAQQVLGNVADAQSTQALVDAHNLRALATSTDSASTSTQTTTAAVSSGQFEEPFRPSPVPSVAPTGVSTFTSRPVPEAPARTLFESGIASTYGEGDGFEGNLTACGRVFHTAVVQIAHKRLPCGTHVLVEDTTSGRSVEAMVTDRGPYIPGRIVDLSWGAFRELDPTGPGLLHVNVYVLEDRR